LRELANPIPTPAPKKKGAAPDSKKGVAAVGGDSTTKGVKRSRDHDIEKVDYIIYYQFMLTSFVAK
jgi:hypothetical protein